jgi:hypothetical protein
MALSREYLERHNIHRLWEDCVEDLVLSQPKSTSEITACIVNRVASIRRRFEAPEKKVVFVIAAPNVDVTQVVQQASQDCEAVVLDGANKDAELIRQDLLMAESKSIFVINYPPNVGEAIAFEGTCGKPQKAVFFRSSSFLKDTARSDPKFAKYIHGPNAVAEYYSAKGQLVAEDSDHPSKDARAVLRDAW